ncbi:uncharacterized protein LOC113866958 isoform X3 [Abrus precatorius]|uniref:Uncharacterized protein LOC113866958 isoform X3 n=1 Tax=Abrus precatorius TaxID=3816 RepID=A0A8B8LMG5_ABRPR|nr:uncharacterized protein LOC113866958 isoform X3 [Abrus precatorius]
MPGGAIVCSGHRFLCLLPHSTRPQLSNLTRSQPVPVQLRSISSGVGNGKRFSSKLSLVPKAAESSTTTTPSLVSDDGFSVTKYAELKPVPCVTYSDAQSLREKCATPILKQVKSDVIRYRYGDEQHLDEALKRIFQYGQGGGIPRRSAPILQMIREEVTQDRKYCLVLVFEAKALQLSDFEQRQELLQKLVREKKIYMRSDLSPIQIPMHQVLDHFILLFHVT